MCEPRYAAGRWFARQGFAEETIYHLLAGGDAAAAAEVVAEQFQPMLNQEVRMHPKPHRQRERQSKMIPLGS